MHKRIWFTIGWIVILMAALVLGVRYFTYLMSHESTDDAFIDAHIMAISPKISGQVLEVMVHDNQLVKQGDTLVRIDPRDYEVRLTRAKAALAVKKAVHKVALINLTIARAQLSSAESNAGEARAQALAVKSEADRAETDLTRMRELEKTGAISSQEFDHSQSAAHTTAANLKAAQLRADALDSQAAAAKEQTAYSQGMVDEADAEVQQAQAEVNQADLELSYTQVLAPADGFITHKTVQDGTYVQVGQNLLAIVPRYVWVVANFKETQLEYLQPGQPVKISIDAFPNRQYPGHVDSIQAGTGARFSLLPPENAVGNYVKVVQRVPVKILFDELPASDHRVGPGMSVQPEVKVREYHLPLLVQVIVGGAFLALLFLSLYFVANIGRKKGA
ncbi:MAG: HlyD family secretion protein [Candidatus Omnitrophica bacterium]|nr:HlyD family secretion protein [Candidatus Omnitrophota bacterium]